MVASEVPFEARSSTTVGVALARRLQGAAGGALLFALGIGLIMIGTVVLDRSSGLPRWVFAIVGLVSGMRGLDLMAKAWLGPRIRHRLLARRRVGWAGRASGPPRAVAAHRGSEVPPVVDSLLHPS